MRKENLLFALDAVRVALRATNSEVIPPNHPIVEQLKLLGEQAASETSIIKKTVEIGYDSEGNMILPEELQHLQRQDTEHARAQSVPREKKYNPKLPTSTEAIPREPRIAPAIVVEPATAETVEDKELLDREGV